MIVSLKIDLISQLWLIRVKAKFSGRNGGFEGLRELLNNTLVVLMRQFARMRWV